MKRMLVITLALIGLSILALLTTIGVGMAAAAEPIPRQPALSPDYDLAHSADLAAQGATPTVVLTNPSVEARSVPTYTLVSATFDRVMDPSTINDDTFFVNQGATPVAGSVDYIAVSKMAVVYPNAPLLPDTAYVATLTTGIQDTSGVSLPEDVVWSFITSDGSSPLDGGMQIYFGDFHSHSGYSDGQGVPADAFATARANGLHFYALTDHSSLLNEGEWQDMLNQANATTVTGEFVGLRGFEFTHPNGHINVVDSETYVWEGDPDYDTLEEFYAWLAAQPTAIGQFNHPAKTPIKDWNFHDYAYDAAADEKICLRETLGSSSEQYHLSLETGWHLGAVENSDTHLPDWGRTRYMGVVAPSLTRDAILDAIRARRTFSVWDRNFALVLQANDHWMGSIIPPTPTIDFVITAYDPDPSGTLMTLLLYDNGTPVAATTPLTHSDVFTWTLSIDGAPGHYYYAKAFHDTDAYGVPTFTSPVWTDSSLLDVSYLPLLVKSRLDG